MRLAGDGDDDRLRRVNERAIVRNDEGRGVKSRCGEEGGEEKAFHLKITGRGWQGKVTGDRLQGVEAGKKVEAVEETFL
jgi:hypothetical protein